MLGEKYAAKRFYVSIREPYVSIISLYVTVIFGGSNTGQLRNASLRFYVSIRNVTLRYVTLTFYESIRSLYVDVTVPK